MVATAAAVAAFYLAPSWVRWLDDTANLVLFCMVVTGLVFLGMDVRSRRLLALGWRQMTTGLASLFTERDPIAQLREHVEALRGHHRNLVRQLNEFRGHMHLLLERIVLNEREIDALLSTMPREAAQDETLRLLQARKVGRLRESNERLRGSYQQLQALNRQLQRMRDRSELMVEDTADLAAHREKEYQAIKASSSAMRSARNILPGDRDTRERFDQSLRSLSDEVGRQLGELDRFLSLSSDFMQTMDLREGVYSSQGLALLQEWEENLTRVTKAGQGGRRTDPAPDGLPLREPDVAATGRPDGNRYERFFD